jgi:hypothetical protein
MPLISAANVMFYFAVSRRFKVEKRDNSGVLWMYARGWTTFQSHVSNNKSTIKMGRPGETKVASIF